MWSYTRPEEGWTVPVSPTHKGITVAWERSSLDSPPPHSHHHRLSAKLGGVLLVMKDYDDDVVEYDLYDSGRQIDEYSSGEYGDPDCEPEPTGGDAEALCRAFGCADAVDAVERLLREPSDTYTFQGERNAAIVKALGLPWWCVGTGTDFVEALGGEEEAEVVVT